MKQSDIKAGGIYGNGATLRVMTRFDQLRGKPRPSGRGRIARTA